MRMASRAAQPSGQSKAAKGVGGQGRRRSAPISTISRGSMRPSRRAKGSRRMRKARASRAISSSSPPMVAPVASTTGAGNRASRTGPARVTERPRRAAERAARSPRRAVQSNSGGTSHTAASSRASTPPSTASKVATRRRPGMASPVGAGGCGRVSIVPDDHARRPGRRQPSPLPFHLLRRMLGRAASRSGGWGRVGIWGKILGGVAGFAMGGPLGALVGAALGHAADSGVIGPTASRLPRDAAGLAAFLGNRETLFAIGVIVLSAKLAKCDGPVKREEIDAFKRLFHIPPENIREVGRLFDEARATHEGFEPFADRLGEAFADNRRAAGGGAGGTIRHRAGGWADQPHRRGLSRRRASALRAGSRRLGPRPRRRPERGGSGGRPRILAFQKQHRHARRPERGGSGGRPLRRALGCRAAPRMRSCAPPGGG